MPFYLHKTPLALNYVPYMHADFQKLRLRFMIVRSAEEAPSASIRGALQTAGHSVMQDLVVSYEISR
jgi:hypothetical protein